MSLSEEMSLSQVYIYISRERLITSDVSWDSMSAQTETVSTDIRSNLSQKSNLSREFLFLESFYFGSFYFWRLTSPETERQTSHVRDYF